MTPRRARFVDEYLVDLNAAAAARRAGYSERTADREGHRLLRNAEVSQAIQARRARMSEATGLTVQLLDRKLLNLLEFDVRKLYDDKGQLRPIHELDDTAAAAIAGIEIEELTAEGMSIGMTKKIKISDRVKPVDLGYRRLGVLREQPAMQFGHLTIVIADEEEMRAYAPSPTSEPAAVEVGPTPPDNGPNPGAPLDVEVKRLPRDGGPIDRTPPVFGFENDATPSSGDSLPSKRLPDFDIEE